MSQKLPEPRFDINAIDMRQGTRRIVSGDFHHGKARPGWFVRYIPKRIKRVIIVDRLGVGKATSAGNICKINAVGRMALLHAGFAEMPVVQDND